MPRQTLTLRSDGRYRCKYDGHQFYGSTQREALAARDAYKAAKADGLRAEKVGLTVSQYAARWLPAHYQGLRAKTYNAHVSAINRLCDIIGTVPLRDVTSTDMASVIGGLSGLSRSHISHIGGTIRALFASAVADRHIMHNPCLAVRSPSGPSGTHRAIEPWERALIHRQVGKHRFAPAIMGMLYQGMRRGEALAFNIDRDVDFSARLVYIREALIFERSASVVTTTKTEAGVRSLPLSAAFEQAIRGRHGLLATDANGGLMTETAFRRAWASFLTALGDDHNGFTRRWPAPGAQYQPISFQPHDLRHSFCTMLYDAGVDIKSAMRWMGHRDQTMTLRIYTHLTDERERQSAQSFISQVDQYASDLMSGVQNGVQIR